MRIKERYAGVLERFAELMPEAATELHYGNAYELLVAVILSAQCTDKRVNMITPAFFEAFPTVEVLASAQAEAVFELIRTCSYPNNKTRSLIGMARAVTERFGGEIPSDMESLLTIPGVGRKTANVMLSVAFGQAAMAVDTHVFRVAERIGLTTGATTPRQTEDALTRHIPKAVLGKAHHWLILHGRYVCKARRPLCEQCGIAAWCRYAAGKNKNDK